MYNPVKTMMLSKEKNKKVKKVKKLFFNNLQIIYSYDLIFSLTFYDKAKLIVNYSF